MLFAQTFSKGFIVVDYYANTPAYEKNCVNKNKPWMHCNGKCQMMKKMQQEDKKDQDNPERRNDTKNETVLSSKSYFASLPTPNFTKAPATIIRRFVESVASGMPFAIFHPPQLYKCTTTATMFMA